MYIQNGLHQLQAKAEESVAGTKRHITTGRSEFVGQTISAFDMKNKTQDCRLLLQALCYRKKKQKTNCWIHTGSNRLVESGDEVSHIMNQGSVSEVTRVRGRG
jgi:Zn-dependent alcohol dehydrogenase